MKNYLLMSLLCIVCFTCCKKDEKKPSVKFKNTTYKEIILNVYQSSADYYNEIAPIATITIPPGAEAEAVSDKFEEGRSYYFDLRSEDDSISNWGVGEHQAYYKDYVKYIKFEYPVNTAVECKAFYDRLNCLGNKTSVTWRAVDMREIYSSDGKSEWNELAQHEKHLVVTIKKDYTVTLSQKTPDNKEIVSDYKLNCATNAYQCRGVNPSDFEFYLFKKSNNEAVPYVSGTLYFTTHEDGLAREYVLKPD